MTSARIILLAVFTICIVFFISCDKEKVTDVTLNKNELFLSSGMAETLIASIQPNNADNQKVKWKSSNSTVASVDNNGLVTAFNDGTATITVTSRDGKKTANCEVHVDYRGKWLGTYVCTERYYNWTNGNVNKDQDYETIVYITGKEDSMLIISENRMNQIHGVKVDVSGSFLKQKMGQSTTGVNGVFIGDSLYMYIDFHNHGGGKINSTFNGKK